MTGYFLYADFNSIENLSSIALDKNQLLFGLLGVAMIILGKEAAFRLISTVRLIDDEYTL